MAILASPREIAATLRERRPRHPGEASLWVLVPSAAIAHEIEQELLAAGAAAASLHLMTPRQALRRVLLERGARPRREADSSLLQAWLAQELELRRTRSTAALRADLDYLARFAAARRGLLRTLVQMRLLVAAWGRPLPSLADDGAIVHSLLPALGHALEKAELDDPAARLARALDLLATPHASDPGQILVLATGETPELVGLARILAPRVPFHFPGSGAVVGPFAERAARLFDRASPAPPALPPARFRVFATQGEEAELGEAARRARGLIAGGVPPHRIAIVPARIEPYESLVAPVLGREDVPFATSVAAPLAAEPVAALARSLVVFAGGNLPRGLLPAILQHADLDPRGVGASAETLLAAAGVLDYVTRDRSCLGGRDELLEAVREADAALGPARPALERFLSDVAAVGEALASASSNAIQAETLLRYLAPLLASREESGAGRRDEVLASVASLADRDRLGLPPLGIVEVPEAVAERIAEGTVPLPGQDPEGVWISAPDRCRGRDFDHVFVLGLNRDQVPRPATAAPYLSEANVRLVREALADARRGLPPELHALTPSPLLPAEVEETEREDLRAIVAAARESLTASFLQANAKGQPRSASPWLRHLCRTFAGSDALDEVLGAESPCFDAVAWTPPARVAARLDHDLSEEEALLHVAFTGGAASLATLAAALRPDLAPTYVAAADWLHARESFVPRAGAALAYDALGLGTSRLLADRLSVSDLDQLGACPLRCFLGRVLAVAPLPPEPSPEEVSQRDVGRVVHDILFRVVDSLRSAGAFAPGATLAGALALARSTISAELDRARPMLLSGQAQRLRPLCERTLATWQEGLTGILELDLAELWESGLRPVAVERSLEGELALGAFTLRLTGRLDRRDEAPDGTVRILDYKTGGRYRDDDAEILREPLKGRKLQLPLYCLLVGQGATGSYPRAELRGVSPIHLDSCKGTLPRRLLSPKLWTHLAGLTETLAVLANLLAQGHYPFRKNDHCAWCDFQAACPRHHPPSVARMARIAELGDFLRLEGKSSRKPLLADVGRSPAGDDE